MHEKFCTNKGVLGDGQVTGQQEMNNCLCLLEIPDFLDESECNHIISFAEKVGLRGSDLHLDEELEKSKEVVRGNVNSLFIVKSPKAETEFSRRSLR